LLHPKRVEGELQEEIDLHIEMQTRKNLAVGMSSSEARRRALVRFGATSAIAEECRGVRGVNLISDVVEDLRFAARTFRKNPAFSTAAVLVLALGIGATAAIFSAVDPILFESLPYPHAQQIVKIFYSGPNGSRGAQTFGTYREIATRSRTLDSVAAMKAWHPTMTGAETPERFEGQLVTSGYFRVLGIPPLLGRDFDPVEDRPHGANVVIISDRLWRRRFNADPGIIGRQIKLDDDLYTVTGVMPRGFENLTAPAADVWSLLQYDPSLPAQGREWGHHLQMVGRVRSGMTIDQTRRELDAIAHSPVPDFSRPPWASMSQGLIIGSLQDDVVRGVKPSLLAVMGAVLLVLMIASVNVVHLQMARGAQRRGEFAMRIALGAGRARLIRQLLTESMFLALLGGALGLAFAQAGIQVLLSLSPSEMPRINAIGLNGSVLAVAFGMSTIIGVAAALVPAFYTFRVDLQRNIQTGSRQSAGGQQLTRRTLVVAEVALACVLLVSAGLLLRSLQNLFAVTPGFNPSGLLTMQVQVSSAQRFPNDNSVHQFFAQAQDAVRRVPGVIDAGFTSQLPLSGDDGANEIYAAQFDHGSDSLTERVDSSRYAVTPGYFEAMGIPLRRGRHFNDSDAAGAAMRPVIIAESFAKRVFGTNDPIGGRVRFGGAADRPWDVIVGVVGDVRQVSLAAGEASALYVNTGQWLWADNPLWLVVRTQGDPSELVPAVRSAIWSVDKDQPVIRVATMESLIAASGSERHFASIVFETFALVAVILAATGLYGLLAGSVTERFRELGVRAALGASSGDILWLVLREGLTLAGIGAVIGLAGAIGASRAIVTLLFGVSTLDPLTYLAMIALLLAVTISASWLPAWRAARIDPSITLRVE
jgi:predicted permease